MADEFIDIKSGNNVNEDNVFTCKPGKFQLSKEELLP
ncbi:MAG: hypothetical protein K0S91_512 [Nitrososphaeraceae archaeon]|jgi:hypothetical protein|nr:hypothetical protein [Nitrososphaeraceae archaeon]